MVPRSIVVRSRLSSSVSKRQASNKTIREPSVTSFKRLQWKRTLLRRHPQRPPAQRLATAASRIFTRCGKWRTPLMARRSPSARGGSAKS